MTPSKCLLVITTLYLSLLSAIAVSAPVVPVVDVYQSLKNDRTSLATKWALNWGEWVPLQDIAKGTARFDTVELPNFIKDLVDDNTFHQQRIGTYAIGLSNLNTTFQQPSIRMQAVNDAWQAWWIAPSGETQFLGESGKIAKQIASQQMRFKTDILRLPSDADSGTLVVYVSAQLYERAGMYGEFEISEFDRVNKVLLVDLISRVALIAVGLLVVFQNLLFYLFRPKERVLLLLAVFAFATLFRALVAADFAFYFLGDPSSFDILTRLKYISIVWPTVAAVHFFSCLSVSVLNTYVVRVGYALLALISLFTLLAPLPSVIDNLLYYQFALGFFSLYALGLAIKAVFTDFYRSKLLMISSIALFIGVTNDVIASQSSGYSFYLAEYGLFLFLFAQTQYHSLRFVSALDTAEHLTENLQQEVAEKTRQLSIHNQELVDKADYLKIQHDRIKELSETDHLTGLYNRQTLDDFLDIQFEQAIAQLEPLALVILDIDNFKSINDQHGHLVGDDCLKAVAGYLGQTNLREGDFIARYGGEEIVIVLTKTSLEKALEMSQRICQGLSDIQIKDGDVAIKLTASFGVSELISHHANSPEHLLKLADDALYQAKARGKNQVVAAS